MLVAEDTYDEGEGAVVRRRHLIALVVTFLIGCALLLVVGCAGVGSESSKKEQGSSAEATASEEARCEGTRTYNYQTKDPQIVLVFTTNDIPGCPKGGLLLGTDKRDLLNGKDGEDKVRGLGGPENLYGGSGNDNLYGGPDGDYELIGGKGDDVLHGGDGGDTLSGIDQGKDVLYGGDGNDVLFTHGGGDQDKLYCGKGKDSYSADKLDYVDSSCEKQFEAGGANA